MRLMPIAITALALTTVATPATAQSQLPSREMDAAQRLNDPIVQDGLAAAVSAVAGIVLDTRVGPLAAITGDVGPNDTLRDVKRREDPYFEERLHDDARRAVATAGGMASGGAAMSVELQRTADRLRAALAPLAGMIAGYD